MTQIPEIPGQILGNIPWIWLVSIAKQIRIGRIITKAWKFLAVFHLDSVNLEISLQLFDNKRKFPPLWIKCNVRLNGFPPENILDCFLDSNSE